MSRLPVVLSIATITFACAGEQGPDPGDPATVQVQASRDTLTALGDTVDLSSTVLNHAGDVLDVPVQWSSSAPAVVRVLDGTRAVAEGPGAATLTAETAEGTTGAVNVVVHQVVASIEVLPAEPSVVAFDTIALGAELRDGNGHPVGDRVVAWGVSDEAIARLEGAVLIGLKPGPVQVRAESGGVTGEATVTVEDGFLVRTLDAAWIPGTTCALDLDSLGYCWDPGHQVAAPVPAELRFASLTVGYFHYCGVTAEGAGYCWGRNSHGQLGAGHDDPVGTDVVPAHPGMTFTVLQASEHDVTCGLGTDGTPFCWGHNDFAQLGRGFRSTEEFDAQTPVGVPALSVIDVSAFHACGAATDGDAWCWGVWGVGDGTSGHDEDLPVPVTGGHAFPTLSTGYDFTCALDAHGAPYCWGRNNVGQLATGDSTNRYEPTPVPGAPSLATITSGAGGSCGVTSEGQAWCWGAGRLAEPVLTAHRFTALATGAETCGITTEAYVLCFEAGGASPRRVLRGQPGAGGVAVSFAAPPPHAR